MIAPRAPELLVGTVWAGVRESYPAGPSHILYYVATIASPGKTRAQQAARTDLVTDQPGLVENLHAFVVAAWRRFLEV